MFEGRFATAVSCIDGRVQMPVIRYLKNRFSVDYVDVISEPGPNRILAEWVDLAVVEAVVGKIRMSVNRHGSRLVAVVGHYDCAGNPAPRLEQAEHTRLAIARLQPLFLNDMTFVGLWVNERWNVLEVSPPVGVRRRAGA